MTKLAWGQAGDRLFEAGVEKAVLYLPDGSGIAWNGLTSVDEKFNADTSTPLYFDGVKVNDFTTDGEFSSSLKAYTYPDEFMEFDGTASLGGGVFVSEQRSKLFSLSYQTKIGNDTEGDEHGYKIHILYNLIAIPSQHSFDSWNTNPSVIEFEWTISSVPQDIPGFRSTAHIVLDSRYVDPFLLVEIEDLMYGSVSGDAELPTFDSLIETFTQWYRVRITDNLDGTWTAESPYAGEITMIDAATYVINNANIYWVGPETYVINDTVDISEA